MVLSNNTKKLAFVSVGLDQVRLIYCTQEDGNFKFMPLFLDTLFIRLLNSGGFVTDRATTLKSFENATWYTNIRPNGRTYETIRKRFTNGYLDFLSPPKTNEEIEDALSELRILLIEQSISFALPGDRTTLTKMIREGRTGNKYRDLLSILNLTYNLITTEDYDFSEIASVRKTEPDPFSRVVRQIKPELNASRGVKHY